MRIARSPYFYLACNVSTAVRACRIRASARHHPHELSLSHIHSRQNTSLEFNHSKKPLRRIGPSPPAQRRRPTHPWNPATCAAVSRPSARLHKPQRPSLKHFQSRTRPQHHHRCHRDDASYSHHVMLSDRFIGRRTCPRGPSDNPRRYPTHSMLTLNHSRCPIQNLGRPSIQNSLRLQKQAIIVGKNKSVHPENYISVCSTSYPILLWRGRCNPQCTNTN
ncbi:hypothetical protein DM02DRAFT_118410 [Periconia macrospinosa]|uniref:Uncharacterized protein n=1 Tax=Periconia macrospinosa TaxID=97972 RepID=A0A2V1DH14_9PLEO|nr:hypothetical protein DM02DRAFT_118410 [Periconia macrospinosa]